MFVLAPICAGCYQPAYSQCATGVNMLSLTHTHTNTLHIAYPHQSSPTQCCWPAVCPVQTDCWVQERCMVVWPWPDKAAPPSPFSICLSLTHLQPYDNPSTRLTHRLPSTNTWSHYHCLCPESPAVAGVCTRVCVLCPCPHHLPPYPEPPALATASHLMCVDACLYLASFELEWFSLLLFKSFYLFLFL